MNHEPEFSNLRRMVSNFIKRICWLLFGAFVGDLVLIYCILKLAHAI